MNCGCELLFDFGPSLRESQQSPIHHTINMLRRLIGKPSQSAMRSIYQQQQRSFCSFGDKRKGSVKWFNSEKGFGFIVDDENSDEIFVHQTAIHAQGFRSLAEGEEVEFEVEIDERQRKKAHNVTGPDGAFVLGAPRPDTNYGFGGGGSSNSSFDSGFGGGNMNRKK